MIYLGRRIVWRKENFILQLFFEKYKKLLNLNAFFSLKSGKPILFVIDFLITRALIEKCIQSDGPKPKDIQIAWIRDKTANGIVAYQCSVDPLHPPTEKQNQNVPLKTKQAGELRSRRTNAYTHTNMLLLHCSLSVLESRCSNKTLSCMINHPWTHVCYSNTQNTLTTLYSSP